MVQRIPFSFRSAGVTCRGEQYAPADAADGSEYPAVVMAHGFGGERSWRLPAFARRFADRGIATFVFDYRTFGDSDGTPRNLISPRRHLEDWRAALSSVRSRPDIDDERVALWGTSFSGGHAVATAARDPDVAAVVAQVPFSDGLATAGDLIRRGGLSYARGALLGAITDLARAAVGRDPHYIQLVGDSNEFAVLNTPDAKPGFESIVPADANVRNECPGRIIATVPFYRPITAATDVACPAFVVEAARDTIVPPWTVDRLVSKLDDVERLRLPVGHFDVYRGDAFERVIDRQLTFFERTLVP
ncbi:alpha/beta hydrolase [Halopiger aswanensis]|uniref:Alpha/beta hydrolase family protein n=1 Tax=Halopiger aswanensis TaxID=148449 RepID=A0A3R7DX46_9EURY|nr:alpha/beta hydrolase [Halopiger aswanensis]RKD89041.1 alpha/beta hydrolase family protein [Halopiger aswanensis]